MFGSLLNLVDIFQREHPWDRSSFGDLPGATSGPEAPASCWGSKPRSRLSKRAWRRGVFFRLTRFSGDISGQRAEMPTFIGVLFGGNRWPW